MRKVTYIDRFFTEDLYEQFSSFSLQCHYRDTNSAKRSFCSNELKEVSPDLYRTFIEYVKETLSIEIADCDLFFYKRNNTIFNPHLDGFPLQLLVYLQGELENLENGTFFVNGGKMAMQVANLSNSAVLFDGEVKHGSIQALHENTGWRYSINCFIRKYSST